MNVNFDDVFPYLHNVRKEVLAEIDEMSNDELLNLAVEVHGLKKFIAEFFSEVEAIAIEKVRTLDVPTEVSSGATVEIKRGSPRKSWDHDSIIRTVSKRVVDMSVDLETGEVVSSPRDMIEYALKCAGVSYWKIGSLKELSIDPSEYCTVSDPVSNLVIRRSS